MMMVKEDNAETGKTHYPVRSVAIMKQHGGSAKDSTLMNGYVLYGGRAAQGMPRTVKNAKIALLDIDLRKTKMAMGVQVVVTDPKKLEDIRQRESDITKVPQRPAPPARPLPPPLAAAAPSRPSLTSPPFPPPLSQERIEKILAAGANVILTTKGIDDMALEVLRRGGGDRRPPRQEGGPPPHRQGALRRKYARNSVALLLAILLATLLAIPRNSLTPPRPPLSSPAAR